jgi:hypothetical protein
MQPSVKEPKRSEKESKGTSPRSILGGLLSVPANFFGGLIVGLTAPVIAVAGIVGGVYLFTKKVPFVSQVTADEATGERSLTLKLMTPDEAKVALEARRAELKEVWAGVKTELEEAARRVEAGSPSTEKTAAGPESPVS